MNHSLPGSSVHSPGKNTGVSSHFHLQGIFLTHGLNPGLRHILYHLSHQGSPQFPSVQLFSCVQLFMTPWTAARKASLSITNSRSLLKLISIELVMPSNCLIFYRPLCLLPSIFPSITVFSNESVLHIRWPKYWSFSFSISHSNKHPGLISFTMASWISLQSKGLSRVFSNTTVQSINSLALSFPCSATLTSIHDYWKNHNFD